MSGTAILSIAKSSTDGIYSVIVWVPNPADPNPKSPTAWIPEGPIALEVPEGEQATPGLCFDGTNNVLLMTLWGEDYPYFAAMVSSHLDLISIDKLPMKKSDNVVTEALAIVSVDGRTIIKAVQSGSDVNENTYWIHQSKGSGWSEITLIPSTGLPTDSQALSGELVCPISMFPSFSYVHYLSYRYSLVANTSGFYLDSFQLQYLPTSPSTSLYCTRTQIQLPSGVTITLDQGSPPVQYLVTSKTICNTEIYLLYIFWAQDSFSPISYCYIELGSDGSVNTSADTIQAQGYGTIGSSVPRDGILFNVVQGMGRVFCFWVVNSSLAGMSCSIGSDGTMQGDWEWVQSSIAGPACKGAFSCVSVPQPWLKLPPSELAKDE